MIKISRMRMACSCLPFNPGVKRLAIVAVTMMICACKAPPDSRYISSPDANARGLAAIERAGCGACHQIPGVSWPKGRTGPSLEGFNDIAPIAGTLPNTAENLAAFVQDAPRIKPDSTMPAMPLSQEESRNVASYLYSLDDD